MGGIANLLLIDTRRPLRLVETSTHTPSKEETCEQSNVRAAIISEGADDDDLFRLAREHISRDHPEMQRTDEQIRDRVAKDAYDA
jgi:hypothetical protein